MGHVRRHVRHFARAELVAFTTDGHAHPPAQHDEHLLMRMRMLVRALARLEAQHANFDLLAGHQAAERRRMLRRHVLFLQRVELVDWHQAAFVPCSPAAASLHVKNTQSRLPSLRAQWTLFDGT